MATFTFQYVLRFNLSVAIVCMVKLPRDNDIQLDNSTEYNHTSNYILNNTIGDDDLDQGGDPCGILESSRRGHSEMVTSNPLKKSSVLSFNIILLCVFIVLN